VPAIHYRKNASLFTFFFPFVSGAPSPNLFLPFISYGALTSSFLRPPSPLQWRSSAMMKLMKWREWRMEVLSLPKSASICPLNPPRRTFLLHPSGMVHHLCCEPTFHDLSVAAIEVDEAQLVEAPPVEDLLGWALSVEASSACWPLPPQLLVAWARLGLVLSVEALLPGEALPACTHLLP
jgi:hypothetical protein